MLLSRFVLVIFLAWNTHAQVSRIPYENLTKNVFQNVEASRFSELLFDENRRELFVGARNHLFQLSMDTLSKIHESYWPPSVDSKMSCLNNPAQDPKSCHNYVKVLIDVDDLLFACGTGAFSPKCTWRTKEDVNKSIIDWWPGVEACPFSPYDNSTAISVGGRNGSIFTGTSVDASGRSVHIYRQSLGSHAHSYISYHGWLNNAQFVGNFETKNHIYFLFREVAMEFRNHDKKIISRIARICKNDPGNLNLLTSFRKTRLKCALPGDYPFYYDEIQGMSYLPDQGLVYATFTTPNNGIPGSAICVFDVKAIDEVFNGKNDSSTHCSQIRQVSNSESTVSVDPSKLFIDRVVEPLHSQPLISSVLERFTKIAVDREFMPRSGSSFELQDLYIANTDRVVKKLSTFKANNWNKVQVNEEIWGPFPFEILNMQFNKMSSSLFLGTSRNVIRIPDESKLSKILLGK